MNITIVGAYSNVGFNPDRCTIFEEATLQYADFYSHHMRIKESIILPEALKVLSEEDWRDIDAGFAKNMDPLSDSMPRDPIYDRLFTKIVMQAPAPIGFGS